MNSIPSSLAAPSLPLLRVARRFQSRVVGAGAVGGALALFAPSAHAFVENVYPGIQCTHNSGAVPTLHFGMLENRAATTSVVNCPIPLKEGFDIDDVGVIVWNANAAQPVTCSLRITELDTTFPNGFRFTQEEQSSVLLNDWNPLHFNGIEVDPSYSTHAFLRCEIPPAVGNAFSRIGNYTTDAFGVF